MKKLGWSNHARKDLDEIFNFYFKKNPTVAARIHDSIIDEAQRLIKWSEIGKVEHLLDSYNFEFQFRSLVTKDGLFKIIYFVDNDMIVISRIWSCRKNPMNLRP